MNAYEIQRLTTPTDNIFLAVNHLGFIRLMESDDDGKIREVCEMSQDAYECVILQLGLGNHEIMLRNNKKFELSIKELT